MNQKLRHVPFPWHINGGAILILLLLSCVAARPLLLEDGWFFTHEAEGTLERVAAMASEIKNGYFYPRWLSQAYFGQGLPFFNFYSPVFYVCAAYIHCIGLPLVLSIKIVCWLFFFLGAQGMFLWIRFNSNSWSALLAASIYLFLPYHFVNIYVRGAMAEFTALAFFPFLFLGIDFCVKDAKRLTFGIILTATASASIILSHNLSALMISPFAFVYLITRNFIAEEPWSNFKNTLIAPLASLGFTAFYWLPVLMEKQYLNSFQEKLTSGYYDYANHFIYPSQLISTFWGYGVSVVGPDDTMSFQLGLTLILFSVLSGIVCFCGAKETRKFSMLVFCLGALGVFMTLRFSILLYQAVPIIHFVQFPWRFLGTASFFLAAFAGLFLSGTKGRIRQFCLVVGVILCVLFSANHRSVNQLISSAQIEQKYKQSIFMGKMTSVDEYIPKWAGGGEPLVAGYMEPKVVSGEARVNGLRMNGSRVSFTLQNKAENTSVIVPKFYFPGWRAKLNSNQEIIIFPSKDGFIQFEPPTGENHIEISFGTTKVRVAGWFISIFTIVIFIFLMLKMHINNNKRTHTECY